MDRGLSCGQLHIRQLQLVLFHLHATGSHGDSVRSHLQPLKSRMGTREQGGYSPEPGVVHRGQHPPRMSPRGWGLLEAKCQPQDLHSLGAPSCLEPSRMESCENL